MSNAAWRALATAPAAFRYANQLPDQIEAAIIAARREKPTWELQDPRAAAAVAGRRSRLR